MITTLLTIILISSLFIFGWSYCTTYTPTGLETNVHKPFNPFGTGAKDKEVAWWFRFYIGNFIYKHVPFLKPMLKPLFMCEVCMSSVYGSIIYWLFLYILGPLSVVNIVLWPFTIVAIAGLNRLIKMIMQK